MHGTFGTICDDFFEIRAASVICRQLGYGPGECFYLVKPSHSYIDTAKNVFILHKNSHITYYIKEIEVYIEASVLKFFVSVWTG